MRNILGLTHKHVVLRERFQILTKTSAVTWVPEQTGRKQYPPPPKKKNVTNYTGFCRKNKMKLFKMHVSGLTDRNSCQ